MKISVSMKVSELIRSLKEYLTTVSNSVIQELFEAIDNMVDFLLEKSLAKMLNLL